MAGKLIRDIGLPLSIANIFAARSILTAKDALSLTEFELMELMDVSLDVVRSAIDHISESVCPPCKTGFLLMQEHVENEDMGGHLPTSLKGLDDALCGGVPFGALTELVGPAGIGKTQFCLKLSLLAVLPRNHGGLNARVIYVDTESKFSSRRLIEIGECSFPNIFRTTVMAKELSGRIVVLRPSTLSEFTESLQKIKLSILQYQVKLVIVDSIAALVSSDNERDVKALRHSSLGWHVSFLKSLSELSRVPIVVTNQVRANRSFYSSIYPFQDRRDDFVSNSEKSESRLAPALGISWAHAVNVRIVLESHSGKRFMKVVKSPYSAPLEFPFVITSSGISLLTNEGTIISGQALSTIYCEGKSILDGESLVS